MSKYDVAAFIWPSYTGDEPRSRIFWGEGIGEWQSVKNSAPKENGYNWGRKPLWGYVNEANPNVMEMEINTALEYGVNVFIYDWYWYDGRPFLENCLTDGFLKAKNNKDMKFYLMWANHDANHLWSKGLSDTFGDTVIWRGDVDFDEFKIVVDRLINKFFKLDNYYTINGCPVFMIYETANFVKGLGGIEGAKKALDYFRNEAKKAGFPDLHLQVSARNRTQINVSGVDSALDYDNIQIMELLGFDSCTHYQFVHFTNLNRDYLEVIETVKEKYAEFESYEKPYFPHVSIGWDNNPRYYDFKDHVAKNNTPENFGRMLEIAKAYADRHPNQPPLITINSWNEWTETSYLEPDNLYGYGYLENVKKVFTE